MQIQLVSEAPTQPHNVLKSKIKVLLNISAVSYAWIDSSVLIFSGTVQTIFAKILSL